MVNEYNTQSKMGMTNKDAFTKLEESILNSIKKMLNLKNIIIKKMQEDNERLFLKCNNPVNRVAALETSQHYLGQYVRNSSILLSNIPNYVADDQLEATVISILPEI